MRFPTVSFIPASRLTPVMFPPGSARLATSPCPTGSDVTPTTGTAASFRRRMKRKPTAKMTSGALQLPEPSGDAVPIIGGQTCDREISALLVSELP